jgi:acyl-CoA thioesterase
VTTAEIEADGPAAAGRAGGTSPFADQMRVRPDPGRPGRWLADVDPRWNCPAIPQGGMMAALAAAAMAEAIGEPGQRLRTQTTVFAAMVPSGRVELDVAVLRRGRTMSQATVTAHAPGEAAGHTTVAVFGSERAGFEFTDLVRPDVPAPLDCPSFRDPPPPDFPERDVTVPFWDNVEGRAALGHAPWEPYVPHTSHCAFWYRFDEPPMRPDGTLDPLAVLALADLMPSSVNERMGPDHNDWWGPSTDLTVHAFEEPRSEWLLASLRARRATGGYASVESALWDEAGTLVAHATQVMYMHFPEGPPEGDRRVPLDQR